jgi:hypothetical protein
VPPPAGLQPPPLWGDEEHVKALLGPHVDELRTTRRIFTMRYRSPEHFVEFFERHYGPTHKAFAALDEPGRAAFAADIVELVRGYDTIDDGTAVAIPAEYLEVVATRSD